MNELASDILLERDKLKEKNYSLLKALKIALKDLRCDPDDRDRLPLQDLFFIMEQAIAEAEGN